MKCGPRHLHDSFKNGGTEFRATFENFEAEHDWSTKHDLRGKYRLILSEIHASQAGDSWPPASMALTIKILIY